MSGRLFGVIETIGDGELAAKLRTGMFGEGDVEIVKASGNGASDRNAILSQAGSHDSVLLIDDTLTPRDALFALAYEDLSERYGYSVMFYGYSRSTNCVLGIKPNPGILLRASASEVLHVAQFPANSFIFIDRRRNKLAFDETLKRLYLDEFLHRSAAQKLIPFNGFYLDASASWTMFEEKLVNRTTEQLKQELDETRLERDSLSKRKISINTDNNVNMFIQYVQAKLAETGAK